MQPPPSPSAAPPSPHSLAVASLVCGIGGFLTGPLTGIPAIITGHIARSRITKAGNTDQGKGLATTGLVLGYITSILFPLIVAICFAAVNGAIQNARKITTRATGNDIVSAIESFQLGYGTMPVPGTSDTVLRTDNDTEFIHVLLGTEEPGPGVLNIRFVKFLVVRKGKAGKNGMILAPDSNKIIGIFDPWGGPYHVALDLNNDETLSVPNSKGPSHTLKGRRAAVWSDGPDRKPGTSDDVTTW